AGTAPAARTTAGTPIAPTAGTTARAPVAATITWTTAGGPGDHPARARHRACPTAGPIAISRTRSELETARLVAARTVRAAGTAAAVGFAPRPAAAPAPSVTATIAIAAPRLGAWHQVD